MKILKKISMAYTLQVFAVILLFGYAVALPVNKTKEPVIDGIVPLEINKLPTVNADHDSIFTINTLEMYKVKAGN
jgi:hypothetical protein